MKRPLPAARLARSRRVSSATTNLPAAAVRAQTVENKARVAIEEMVGTVCFRPILLTALAAAVGASVILTDPIFQRLTIRLMAGGIACMHLAPLTVPLLCFMAYSRKQEPKHQPGASAAGGLTKGNYVSSLFHCRNSILGQPRCR